MQPASRPPAAGRGSISRPYAAKDGIIHRPRTFDAHDRQKEPNQFANDCRMDQRPAAVRAILQNGPRRLLKKSDKVAQLAADRLATLKGASSTKSLSSLRLSNASFRDILPAARRTRPRDL